MSTLTAFPFIQEGSEATPGLFNRMVSQLSDNLASIDSTVLSGHFEFLSIGSTPPSYVTTAAITIAVNSAFSDYLYLTDSSGARSNYVIGSRAGGTADGLNIWDASGATMIASFSKQSVRFFQNVVGPVFDLGGSLTGTFNAAVFGTASDSTESRIQAAVDGAAIAGVPRVFLPDSFVPFSASSVSFIDTVRLIREGGDASVYDVLAYGATRNGSDDSAWQGAVNAASVNGGVVHVPKSNYTLSQVVVSASNVAFDIADGTVVTRTAAGIADKGMLQIQGAVTGASTTLSSVGTIGSVVVNVASGTGFVSGDYVQIESDATLGVSGQHPFLFEYNNVLAVSGSTVTLRVPLRNHYDTAVATVHLNRTVPLTGIVVRGGTFISSGGGFGDCVRLEHCIDPSVTLMHFSRFGDVGLTLYRCFGGAIRECSATSGSQATDSWGFRLNSCERVLIDACEVRDHDWDGFDLTFGTMYCQVQNSRAYNCGDAGFLIGHGLQGHHNVIANCVVVGSGAASYTLGNSTYSGDHDNILIGCRSFKAQNHAFTLRQNSTGNRFVGCDAEYAVGIGFNVIDVPCQKNSFVGCSSNSNTQQGFSINAPENSLVECRALGNAQRGISLSGATSALVMGCVVDGTNASTSHNFLALANSDRVRFIACRSENAGASQNGFHINASQDVLIEEPIARNNGGWGIRILESAGGDSARARWSGGTFSGNGSGAFTTNQTIFQPERTTNSILSDALLVDNLLPSGNTVSVSSSFFVTGPGRTDGPTLRHAGSGNYELRHLGTGQFQVASDNGPLVLSAGTSSDALTLQTAGSNRIIVRSGGTVDVALPILAASGSATSVAYGYSSDISLGWFRSGVSTMALSFGTLNLATQAVRLSMRTLAASAVTASAVNTNVARDEVVFTVNTASGASLVISSGGTAWIFNSVTSAILA